MTRRASQPRTVDSLVFAIPSPRTASRRSSTTTSGASCARSCASKLAGLADAIGGPAELEHEFDTVLAGRGIATLEDYLAIDRPGRGRRLGAAERRLSGRAWERYRETLQRAGRTDWPLLRCARSSSRRAARARASTRSSSTRRRT